MAAVAVAVVVRSSLGVWLVDGDMLNEIREAGIQDYQEVFVRGNDLSRRRWEAESGLLSFNSQNSWKAKENDG